MSDEKKTERPGISQIKAKDIGKKIEIADRVDATSFALGNAKTAEVSSASSKTLDETKPVRKRAARTTVAVARPERPTLLKVPRAARTRATKTGAVLENSQPPVSPSTAFNEPDEARRANQAVDPTQIGNETLLRVEPIDKGPENSIEPSPLRLISAETQPPLHESVEQSTMLAETSVNRPGLGERLLTNMGSAAQKAGVWLSKQGRAVEPPTTTAFRSASKPDKFVLPIAPPHLRSDISTVVPESVTRRFLKVEKEFFFQDRTPAFSDRGNLLATRGDHPEVVRSLVEIAKARGWDDITVNGADEFRRRVWMEAVQNGLKVVGYQPTVFDLAELSNRPENNKVEKTRAKDVSLANHAERKSVQTRSARGAGGNAGGGLAQQASGTESELTEKARAFKENKPSFVVKKYPDLVGAYGIVEAAKAFANERLPESARDEFVVMAQRHVTQKILEGALVKGPKICIASTKARVVEGRHEAPEPAAIAPGKSPRTKEISKER